MAEQAISGLPEASSATATDRVVVNQGGVTQTVSTEQILALGALADDVDIDFSTASAGKVLAAVPSGGKAYSFVTPASGGGGDGALASLDDIDFTHVGPNTVLGTNAAEFAMAERVTASAASSQIIISFAAPVEEGELIVLFVSFDNGTLAVAPSSMTPLGRQTQNDNNNALQAFYLIAAGGEQTFTITGTSNFGATDGAALMERYTGAQAPAGFAFSQSATTATVAAPADSIVVALTSAPGGLSQQTPIAPWQSYFVNSGRDQLQVMELSVTTATSESYTFSNADGTAIFYIPSAGNKPYAFGPATLASATDVDFTTAAAGKVLAAAPSGGKPYSFVTPASGATSGGGSAATTYDAMILEQVALAHYWPLNTPRDAADVLDLSVGATTCARAASIIPNGDLSTQFSAGGYYKGSTALNQPPGSTLTYELFVQLTALPSAQSGLIAPADTAGVALDVDATGQIHILFAYELDQATGVVLTAGTTYGVALTYDGTTANLYINGATTPAYTYANPLVGRGPDGTLRLASRNSVGALPCSMAKVAYYTVALAAATIAAHYAARSS